MKHIVAFMIMILIVVAILVPNNKEVSPYEEATEQFWHEEVEVTVQSLTNHQPGIYYFGFEDCPWCQELLPVLEKELAKK